MTQDAQLQFIILLRGPRPAPDLLSFTTLNSLIRKNDVLEDVLFFKNPDISSLLEFPCS